MLLLVPFGEVTLRIILIRSHGFFLILVFVLGEMHCEVGTISGTGIAVLALFSFFLFRTWRRCEPFGRTRRDLVLIFCFRVNLLAFCLGGVGGICRLDLLHAFPVFLSLIDFDLTS